MPMKEFTEVFVIIIFYQIGNGFTEIEQYCFINFRAS